MYADYVYPAVFTLTHIDVYCTSMAVTTFDTYKAVALLQKHGLPKDAAEGITELLKHVTEDSMVTKADLDLALHKQTVSLIKWQTGVLIGHAVATAALTVALIQLLAR